MKKDELGGAFYVECSALTREGVGEVFKKAVIAASMKDPPLVIARKILAIQRKKHVISLLNRENLMK